MHNIFIDILKENLGTIFFIPNLLSIFFSSKEEIENNIITTDLLPYREIWCILNGRNLPVRSETSPGRQLRSLKNRFIKNWRNLSKDNNSGATVSPCSMSAVRHNN